MGEAMRKIMNRYRARPAGAHRAVRPGPWPVGPAVDPWHGHPLFPSRPRLVLR